MHYVNPIIKDLFRIPQPEGREGYIRLDQNENPDGVPEWLFRQVMERLSPAFLSIYTEETKLTGKYADFFNLKIDNVTLTAGSVVGMGYIIKVFGEKGKKLLCVTPTFGMYKVYAEMSGMVVESIKYNNDYTFDVQKILDKIDANTGIVALVNPNMPIGNVYTQEEINAVVKKAEEYNALVIIDEAYYYFYDKSSLDLIQQYDNVIILRTFSKMLSIPALRLGVIIAASENIRCINNYKPHYTVNALALAFGEAIIDYHDKIVAELQEKFMKGKEYLFESLKNHGYSFMPSYGCFVCITPRYKTAEYITDKLKKENILILCGKGDAAGFLRVTIWDKKYMELFISALLKIDIA